MTARNLYEGVLIELNKENAPNVLLEDFNYFANKAINNYINKRYNIYDINQQTTDDLRVLKATAMLKPTQCPQELYSGMTMAGNNKMATYEVTMPSDYLHILNCICIYKVNKTYKCYNAGDSWRAPATRLTADMYSLVLDNFWNKPTYKRPYYYIHNVNTSNVVPTNPYGKSTVTTYAQVPAEIINKIREYLFRVELNADVDNIDDVSVLQSDNYSNSGNLKIGIRIDSLWSYQYRNIQYFLGKEYDNGGTQQIYVFNLITTSETNNGSSGTDVPEIKQSGKYKYSQNGASSTYSYGQDGNNNYIYLGEGLPDTISISSGGLIVPASNRERGQGIRYGNVSEVRLEIRYGTDTSVFLLTDVYVDYIKAPQNIRLTQEEIDLTEDTSQMLEYPDYVCQEIINELVHLIMENISDLRLQTHPVVSLSIANPAQALTQQAQGLSA